MFSSGVAVKMPCVASLLDRAGQVGSISTKATIPSTKATSPQISDCFSSSFILCSYSDNPIHLLPLRQPKTIGQSRSHMLLQTKLQVQNAVWPLTDQENSPP